MTSLAGLILIIISLWICQIIDGIPHIFSGFPGLPWWLWLGVGSIVVSWLIKD
ncbi:hypothetical protein [Leptothoe kymatousa]|uniref:DUF5668 domain-containing protein n=1 Tax=Leptothoe kymatousa TAU-MAC 1615 TaxID=2364775 RepID=A0ABS5Y2H8_9CYAN|nr:hypothetical protein [Leptothoe kymatousa]MBT9311821.1 hypothetical protein [Leptothoe kymatousa TAU-MAC 1615]